MDEIPILTLTKALPDADVKTIDTFVKELYRAAFNAGLEAAAKVVKASYRGVYDGDTCATAVRALEKK